MTFPTFPPAFNFPLETLFLKRFSFNPASEEHLFPEIVCFTWLKFGRVQIFAGNNFEIGCISLQCDKILSFTITVEVFIESYFGVFPLSNVHNFLIRYWCLII